MMESPEALPLFEEPGPLALTETAAEMAEQEPPALQVQRVAGSVALQEEPAMVVPCEGESLRIRGGPLAMG